MRRLLLVLLIALSMAAIGHGFAQGSFSAVVDPLALAVDLNVEQSLGQVDGWTLYAGSGMAWTPAGIEKLQPYTLACQAYDLLVAGAEFCVELRAPLVGDGSIARLFLSVAW